MANEPFGRIVRVQTLYMDESGFIDEVWFAAIDDDVKAVSEVRAASGSTTDTNVSVVGRLSPSTINGLKLVTGKVRSAA
jgi:hypothetical protein